MIRVNLLKSERKDVDDRSTAAEDGGKKAKAEKDKSTKAAKKTPTGNLVLVVVLVLIGALAVLQSQSLSRERNLLSAAQDEAARLQPVVDKLDAIEWQKLYLEKKVELIRTLRAQQGVAVGILDAVAKDIPDWVWLTELVLNKTGVLIKGKALSLVLVSDFVRNLERAGPFAALSIINTQQRTEGQNAFIEFTLMATLTPPVPPEAATTKPRTERPCSRSWDNRYRKAGIRSPAMNERPWYQYLIVGLIFGLFAYLVYFKPKQANLKNIRAERIQVEDQVANLQIKKRQIDKLQAELVELGKSIAELEPLIPAKKEEGEILRNVQQLAFDTQLDVLRFSPDREIPKEYYNEKPIAVEVVGSYHNLGLFFDRMLRFPRIFNIDDFTVRALPSQSDETTISAVFTAKTYFFLDISQVKRPERPGPAAALKQERNEY